MFQEESLISSKPACPQVPLPCDGHHYPPSYPSEKM